MVNRGSQIFAEGTATEPVVFTSRQSIEGTTDIDSIGQWGGLVLLGRAAISTCPGTSQLGSATCEAQVEGANGFYGGNDDADNTGVPKYARVMHSGLEVLPDVELNRSEEHTSELSSPMRTSYADYCLRKKKKTTN